MAIVLEDGTGKADSETYISVTDANTYHTNLGEASWTGSDTVKEQALRKATDYIEHRYGLSWTGYRKTSTQALSWPREYVPVPGLRINEYLTDNTIPVELKRACASLAVRALTNDLIEDEERAIVSETVDVISTTYSEFSPQQTGYPEIDFMLRKFLKGSGGLEMVRV